MAMPVLQTRALAKSFGVTPVLASVDLSLDGGQGAAIVGRNGAGKSTLVRILAGLTAPSSGGAEIFGVPSYRSPAAVRRRIGVLTHRSLLYPNLTAYENLEFCARLYGVADPDARAADWLERLSLAEVAGRRVAELSRGMEQRLAIARAMIADPDLILLDEPFASLDERGALLVATLIREALDRGCSVLFTAHTPREVEGADFALYDLIKGRLIPVISETPRRRARALREA
jgi:heme exporter protein A